MKEIEYDEDALCEEDRVEYKKRGAMYKYGYVVRYLKELPNEDKLSEINQRFLKQVRESNGYDVDCRPDSYLSSPFYPCKPYLFNDRLDFIANEALTLINEEETMKANGKQYEFVRIKRFVQTRGTAKLFTLRVKDVGDSSLQTLRVCVMVPMQSDFECRVEEWMLLPSDGKEQEEEEEAERRKEEFERLRMEHEVESAMRKAERLKKRFRSLYGGLVSNFADTTDPLDGNEQKEEDEEAERQKQKHRQKPDRACKNDEQKEEEEEAVQYQKEETKR